LLRPSPGWDLLGWKQCCWEIKRLGGKFKLLISNELWENKYELAYTIEYKVVVVIMVGTRENFYEQLKR